MGFVGEKAGAVRYPPYNYKRLGMVNNLLKNRKLPSFAGFLGYILSFVAGVISILVSKMI